MCQNSVEEQRYVIIADKNRIAIKQRKTYNAFCNNCNNSNYYNKPKYKTNHTSFSSSCPIYVKELKRAREKIKYN